MLQQTRVAAVIPYYERFLQRFPDPKTLADAPEAELLSAWAGLGYYSRARNLQKAARQINGAFPAGYEQIRELAGVGDYTAAAVASIAFQLPHAVLDGNVARVLARVTAEGGDISAAPVRRRLQGTADTLLDVKHPGDFNQAIMELGATVCLPRDPQCLLCPLAEFCAAKQQNRQNELPVKLRRKEIVKVLRTLLLVERNGRILMWQRPVDSDKLAGFWELPEPELLPQAVLGETMGEFRHSITNHSYVFRVTEARTGKVPRQFRWVSAGELRRLPFSTTVKKAFHLAASKVTTHGVYKTYAAQ